MKYLSFWQSRAKVAWGLMVVALALAVALSAPSVMGSARPGMLVALVQPNPLFASWNLGSTTSVSISASTVVSLNAFQCRFSFNPAYVQVVDADALQAGVQMGLGSIPSGAEWNIAQNSVDNTLGTAILVAYMTTSEQWFDGAGSLAIFDFLGVQAGATSFTLEEVTFTDRFGGSLATGANNGTLQVNSGGAGTPTATPTATPTLTQTPTPGPTPTGPALVVIDPPLRWVNIGMTTTVDIRILNVADLYGAEAHISYNPAIVQVVDQDPGVSGVQITVDGFPHGDYVALNHADNGIGYLELALTQLTPRPSVNGSGTLATITFLAVGWGISPVDVITATLADPRGVEILSTWVDGVIQVGGTITPSPTPTQTPTTTTTVTPTPTGSMTPTPTVTLDPNAPGTLRGHVLFQGRPTPPSPRWSSPLTVTVHLNPSTAPLYTFGTICDTSGYFTVTGITTGTYSVKVHDWHSLKNRRDNLYIDAGMATGEFGTLLEGDMDLNDVINILDYSILTQGYNHTSVQPGWDPRTDLDNSLGVDILDYSLLVSNYGRSGETVVAGGNPFAKDTDPPKPAALAVPLRLRPASPAP